MDREIMDDVYRWLAEERVNVEFMFADTRDFGLIVSCRIRPWRQDTNRAIMVLAGGRTADEAIYSAAEAWSLRNTIALDWAARAATVGVIRGTPSAPMVRRAFPGSDKPQDGRQPDHVTEGTREPENGRQNGSQSHTRRGKMALVD